MKYKKKDQFTLKEEYFCHTIGFVCTTLFILPFISIKKASDCYNILKLLNTYNYLWIIKIFLILWTILTFYLAFRILKQCFITNDNPISKIRSAPQGYVELEGIQHYLPKKSLLSPLTKTNCTWYAYLIEEKRDKSWCVVESGESDEQFLIIDTTGQCVIYPEGADIFPHIHKEWSDSVFTNLCPRRYTELLLTPNEYIYVSGVFCTLDNPKIKEQQEEVFKLIKEWKLDYPKLLQDFNIKVNQKGEIDPEDWEKVVKNAEQQISLKYSKNSENSENIKVVNTISKHGLMLDQPFIISALRKKDLLKKLYFKFVGYFMLFFVLTIPTFTVQTWYIDWFKLYCKM